jgi:hypothetical protein
VERLPKGQIEIPDKHRKAGNRIMRINAPITGFIGHHLAFCHSGWFIKHK